MLRFLVAMFMALIARPGRLSIESPTYGVRAHRRGTPSGRMTSARSYRRVNRR
ncbi:hypothetical protein LCGC14_1563710 [marine sediment metagenome]|uniref:Uncharacterized protein n=1 Tax=marine sediment metagenome TaxID=412755 RepID=A0A0F9LMD5_9ZZZZ